MLELHFAVLIHAGIYGSGERAVLTTASVFAAINQLWRAASLYNIFSLAISISAAFVAARFFAQGKSASKVAWVIYLLISATLCAAAVFKHFGWHYFIPTAVPIIFLTGFVLANSHSIARFAIITASIYMLHSASRVAEHFYQRVQRTGLEDDMLVKRVLQLPIKPDELRVWGYRLGAKQYLTRFIAQMVNNRRLDQMVTNAYPIDKSTAPWFNWDVYGTERDGSIDEVPWRYSIIPKSFAVFSAGKQFPYSESSENGSVVLSNSRTVVIERRFVAKQLPTMEQRIFQH
jgi:hypothetical protein